MELLTIIADLLGGAYTLWPDGMIESDSLLGMIAGCGTLSDPGELNVCVEAAFYSEMEG